MNERTIRVVGTIFYVAVALGVALLLSCGILVVVISRKHQPAKRRLPTMPPVPSLTPDQLIDDSGEIVGVIALCADVTAESTQNPQSNDPGTIFRV